MKRKLTLIDIIIILVILTIGVIGLSMVSNTTQDSTKTVTYKVLAVDQLTEIVEAVKETDNVLLDTASNTTGKVVGVEAKNTEESYFDLKNEKYTNTVVDYRNDIYVTIEADAKEYDWGYELGEQKIRVGEKQNISAPAYSLTGYIVEIIDW